MLRISSFERIVKCPGSVFAQSDFEGNSTNDYARYGTHGHLCMEHTVLNRDLKIMPHPEFVEHNEFDLVGDVDRFWRIVNGIVDNHGGWQAVTITKTERPVMCKLTHPTETPGAPSFLVPGTCDLTIYFPKRKVLSVVDYKFGMGYVPAAEYNLQLGGYALGAYQEFTANPAMPEIEKLEVNLITLGTGHSAYTYDKDEIYDLQALLYHGCKDAMAPDAPRALGSHCKYCKAFMTNRCPESTKLVPAIEKYGLTPAKLTLETAIKIGKVKEVLKQGVDASEALIRHTLEQGKKVPGYYLGKASKYKKIPNKKEFIKAAQASGIAVKTDITTNWTDIEKQLRKKRKCTVKQAKDIIESELGNYYTIQPGRRPLKKG